MNIAVNANMSGEVLDTEALRQLAPSIFASKAHASRSERYGYIPTSEVVDAMADEGFLPVAAKQNRTRDLGRRGFAKHMIRFRRPDAFARRVGDTLPEVVVINSHDGSSAYIIMAGLFRLVCLNGLIVGETLNAISVPHKGDVAAAVVDASHRILADSVRALEAPAIWSGIDLDAGQRTAFAEAAHRIRFTDRDGEIRTPIQPSQLLVPRRDGDTGRDLWTVFNVVQENSIRGGLVGNGFDARNHPRRTTTRAINGIKRDVRLNKALWSLAEDTAAALA